MTGQATGLVLAVSVAGAIGCGGRGIGPRDAGTSPDGIVDAAPDGIVDVAPAPGLRAFAVTAVLTPTKDAQVSALPAMGTFTLVLDVEAGRAIAGGTGLGKVVPVTTVDGLTFKTVVPFAVGFSSGASCASVLEIRYDALELTVSGETLEGKATGSAQISCGDCLYRETFAATVAGVADKKPPFLIAGPAAASATPFDGFALLTSKPLPATATARLVADDGSTVPLVPDVVEGTPPLVVGFHKPEVVLRPGQTYTASADGLVDFLGLPGATEAPLKLTAFKDAPVVPEDGFESAVGATVGGANLVRGGVLKPIAGTASAYVGRFGSPAAAGAQPSPVLNVRLALQPGDKKLRFSYRVVSTSDALPFGGVVSFGSVGHKPVPYGQLAGAAAEGLETWPNGLNVFISPVKTAEFDLPADAQDELVVSIASYDTSCGGLLPPPAAVLVDDLRVE